jgi:hypothetical protein
LESASLEAEAASPVVSVPTKVTEEEKIEETFLTDTITTRKNCISLFGTFTVTDKNGRDMTYMFSPKIRYIFIYILINSITKDGVLSSDMNSLFWPDKPDDKIKNLKNVTMNHSAKPCKSWKVLNLPTRKVTSN